MQCVRIAEHLFVFEQAMLESIGVPLDKLKFVRGTDYQLSRYVVCQCCKSVNYSF